MSIRIKDRDKKRQGTQVIDFGGIIGEINVLSTIEIVSGAEQSGIPDTILIVMHFFVLQIAVGNTAFSGKTAEKHYL